MRRNFGSFSANFDYYSILRLRMHARFVSDRGLRVRRRDLNVMLQNKLLPARRMTSILNQPRTLDAQRQALGTVELESSSPTTDTSLTTSGAGRHYHEA